MEYLELIKKYWSMNEEFPQSSTITCTYFFLLESWDKNNREDFEISDYDISSKLKINRNTIISNRKILRDLGLINYQITKGFPTLYKIIPDYVIRKGKEVILVAEKEKTVSKKAITQVISVMSPVQEAISHSVQITPPTTPVVFPSLIPKTKEKQVPKTPSNIPSFEEFMNYAKTLDIYEEGLDVHLKIKYETWKDDGWVSGYNKPIVNWKQTLKNTIPYLRSNNKNIFNVPKINRPKSTYNE
ncbi:transcriptional regulator [Capnocytophaga endodontalis]|uniref:Transcriptional regulator n=1 Tax=Capnocytophaga endodontalis TaxID=2708117 RepID=A0A1Z4BSH5_9FLAO|nr:transcriptional regulator [Capnocytophaga endodontalis]ASF44210.1 transcriptional regulator [Capnocytophaga endodontalis]